MLWQFTSCCPERNFSWTPCFEGFGRAMASYNTLYSNTLFFSLVLFFWLWSLDIYLHRNENRFWLFSAVYLTKNISVKFIWQSNLSPMWSLSEILKLAFKPAKWKCQIYLLPHLIHIHRKHVCLLKTCVLSALWNSSYISIQDLIGKYQLLDQSAKYPTNIQVTWVQLLGLAIDFLLCPWVTSLLYSVNIYLSARGSFIAKGSLPSLDIVCKSHHWKWVFEIFLWGGTI